MKYQEDKVTEGIIQSIISVHQTLGPGFLESVYRRALLIELRRNALAAETEKEIVIYYPGEEVGRHRLDILVESKVVVELKTVDELGKAQYAQVRSYLKATGLSCPSDNGTGIPPFLGLTTQHSPIILRAHPSCLALTTHLSIFSRDVVYQLI